MLQSACAIYICFEVLLEKWLYNLKASETLPLENDCLLQAVSRASEVPTGFRQSWGTVWNVAYVLQRSDRMEHVCTVPQAAGLMLSHLTAMQHRHSIWYRSYLPSTLTAQPELDVYVRSSFESLSHIGLGVYHWFTWSANKKLMLEKTSWWHLLGKN